MTDRITLAPDDAAKVLGIGASTLQDWTRRGIVPSIKIGGVRLYSLRALERWAEEASGYEEAGRDTRMGPRQRLSPDWRRPVGRVRQGRASQAGPLRQLGAGGEADAR